MAKTLAMVFGVVFVLVGLLGFVGNPIVGTTGLFETDGLHNIVHLLVGIILIVVAATAAQMSSMTLKIVGVVYLLLAVVGFVTEGGGPLLGLVTANVADTYLHLVLGAVILIAGFASTDKTMAMGGASM
jgi:Domain of unknown function (DUF4383)